MKWFEDDQITLEVGEPQLSGRTTGFSRICFGVGCLSRKITYQGFFGKSWSEVVAMDTYSLSLESILVQSDSMAYSVV